MNTAQLTVGETPRANCRSALALDRDLILPAETRVQLGRQLRKVYASSAQGPLPEHIDMLLKQIAELGDPLRA